jgi:hypothetical protein
MSKIKVMNTDVSVIKHGTEDYISLTDMIKAKEGSFFIESWLRNRNTVEFLGMWEMLNNPNFNSLEFEGIKMNAGLNSFSISVKQWSEKTNSTGLIAKTGRYGGTYAHQDIAFEFGTWISPMFKLYLIKEFKRLKEEEAARASSQWDFRRFLSKVNYKIQTDSIKENIIPIANISKDQEGQIYASEAEVLNLAVFGITARDWRLKNPDKVLHGSNMREYADIPQLTVLANLESHNADMIRSKIPAKERLVKLRELAIIQLKSLRNINYGFSIQSPNT